MRGTQNVWHWTRPIAAPTAVSASPRTPALLEFVSAAQTGPDRGPRKISTATPTKSPTARRRSKPPEPPSSPDVPLILPLLEPLPLLHSWGSKWMFERSMELGTQNYYINPQDRAPEKRPRTACRAAAAAPAGIRTVRRTRPRPRKAPRYKRRSPRPRGRTSRSAAGTRPLI